MDQVVHRFSWGSALAARFRRRKQEALVRDLVTFELQNSPVDERITERKSKV